MHASIPPHASKVDSAIHLTKNKTIYMYTFPLKPRLSNEFKK